jgi:hypothetical protein
VIVVTDETVWAALGEQLRAGCEPIALEPIVLAPGGGAKNWPG